MTRPSNQNTVIAMHGIVQERNERLFSHRNMVSVVQFGDLLRSQRTPFVPLATALSDGGAALTIDDGTLAGLDAALMARAHDHAVTFFINGENIAQQLPYSFAVLNTLLDAKLCSVLIDGRSHDLVSYGARKAFRKAIRSKLRCIPREVSRLAFLSELGRSMGVIDLQIPRHLTTITVSDLSRAVDAGVDIQNHGWSHTHFTMYNLEDALLNVRDGRSWIHGNLGHQPDYFAVPFGDTVPLSGKTDGLYRYWLLLHDVLHDGFVGPRVFNRTDIEVQYSRL